MAQFGEMEWEDDDGGGSGGGKKSNTKDSFLRLDEGSNKVRLITKPHQYIVHKGVKKKGEKGYGQKVNCSNPDGKGGKGACPLCDKGLKAGQRWFLGVIEQKNHTYKILDVSYQVYSQIKKLARNTEVWGDPTKFDIDIVVDKAGGPTGYYSVQPIPHKPLSVADEETKAKAEVDDLKRRVLPPTTEQVQSRMDKLLEGEEPEPPPPPQPKNANGKGNVKATGKKVATPQIVAEDDDNVEDVFPSYDGNSA